MYHAVNHFEDGAVACLMGNRHLGLRLAALFQHFIGLLKGATNRLFEVDSLDACTSCSDDHVAMLVGPSRSHTD